jgi:SAM-dependent methyltransferase
MNKRGVYLDVGCGTGNYSIALHNKGYSIKGIDPATTMLKQAMQKNTMIEFTKAKAECIPFESYTFNGIFCLSVIHHFFDLEKAFSEISRVLKKKGRLIIFTQSPQQIDDYWLNYYFAEAMSKHKECMPSIETIELLLEKFGVRVTNKETYYIKDDLMDYFLYCKKKNPEFYLDNSFRSGMSVFAAKANKEEVDRGCAKLKRDIESGYVYDLINKCGNQHGDYTFIVSQKY